MINTFGNLRKLQCFGQDACVAGGSTNGGLYSGACVPCTPSPCFPCRPCPPPSCQIVYKTVTRVVNPQPAPGPSPTLTPAYAYVYNTSAQTVGTSEPVAFAANGEISGGIEHTAGSDRITLAEAGTYGVWFTATGTAGNQFALFLNGAAVAGSLYGTTPGAAGAAARTPTAGFVVVEASAGSTLELLNSTGSAVALATNVGGAAASVNASVMIVRLA